MKVFILFMLIFVQSFGFSQLYISVGSGYAFSFPKQSIESVCDEQKNYDTAYFNDFVTNKYFSFGNGYKSIITTGYNFNQNISVELRTSALISQKIKTILSNYYPDNSVTQIEKTYSAIFYNAIPSVILKSNIQKIEFSIRLGFIFGTGKINYKSVYTNFSNGNTGTDNIKFYGGFSVGFCSAISTAYIINSKWSLYGELEFISLSYAPKKFKFTTSPEEMNFTDEFANRIIGGIHIQRISYPFSSIGINIGVKYSFGKKQVKK